ncbi:MAG: TonB-dependent outer membrane protein SusC/RagA, conserved site [Gemmatimonadetes bacterium]|jgi:TonB-dependent SusC/RagA subfamily outer membrane receptor|nr:TonB-dependent outer membrane protein SusC/RagA, conserved site [Gemmatimonadota bacterium]
MPTRGSLNTFSGRSVLACCFLAAACHSSPGGPALPPLAPEAVDVGYGTQAPRDVTSATAKADSSKLMANSPRTVSDMLVGRFAGVEVYQLAGGGTSIRIRGARSLKANQEPLFVLDGMPQHNGSQSLMDLDPHDIKSIEVIKDGQAAVYGSRGANGVILISTRRSVSP